MSTESAARVEIAATTIEFLAGELKIQPTQINENDVLRELPGADSMKMLRVVSKLERQWDVEFEDEDIFSATTVAELIRLVEKNVGGSEKP